MFFFFLLQHTEIKNRYSITTALVLLSTVTTVSRNYNGRLYQSIKKHLHITKESSVIEPEVLKHVC